MDTNSSQRMIGEAIRKIALGRSLDRINMAPSGTSGIGTARLIHGYVAKINDDPAEDNCGTIDVGEFIDETASSEPIMHKSVLLAGMKDNSGGFLIIPTLFSDVTIVTDSATKYSYVVNFSHADFIQLHSHRETIIGVVETKELDPEDNDSPDYDELEKTGNEATTHYTSTSITTTVKDKDDKESSITISPESISQKIDKSEITQTTDKISQKVGSTTISVADKKVTLGDEKQPSP